VQVNHIGRRRRFHIAGLLVATLATSPLAAVASDHTTRAVAGSADLSKIHIDNFGRIDANYFRGSQPKGQDYADLAALGVKTLINLTSDDADESEASMAKSAGLKYLQIPMTTRVVPTADEITTFLKAVTDPASQPVYVHCVGGRHRTGVMTAIYRMTLDKWTGQQAFKEMKQYKFGADFLHPEFKAFVLGGYPAMLASGAATSMLSAISAPATKSQQ
jgi:uncharacterized protein (TIGR01244 family)